MQRLAHAYLAYLATFALLVGAWAAVVLPVHAATGAGLTEMVLCADGKMKTVTVDAQGNAAGKSDGCHHCPDCLPTLTGGIVPTQYNALRPDVATAAPHPITNLAFKASTTRWNPARAPPLKA